MNIAVIGLGGVGGYFGGKLCRAAQSSGDKVHFIARGEHLKAILQNGLRVTTSGEGEWISRPASASAGIESLCEPDFVLVCVKSYDLEKVAARLDKIIGRDTVLLPLLNGVDVYERMRRVLTKGVIYPACVFIGTHIESPGVVAQNGGACKILFGPDPSRDEPVSASVTELFSRSNIKFEQFDDPRPSIWNKFVFIAAYGLVTAAYDAAIDKIVASKELSEKTRSIMTEVALSARALGIALSDDVVEINFNKGKDFAPGTKTSFQRDVERANMPDERDLFGGTVLRLGRSLGIPTPTTAEVWEALEKRKPSVCDPD